jgi:imidazolonepropionase-like amidohydrolase
VANDVMRALLFVLAASLSAVASGQDLVITNARIVDGVGTVIESGTIVVSDGRIESVSAGAAPASPNVQTIDAEGMTVLPGFIDAHRHIMRGDDEQWFAEESVARMQEFLDAGFTTLMSGGGPVPGIVELERRIEAGELNGPRIVTSGRADPRSFRTAEEARTAVAALAEARVDIVKASVTPEEKDMLGVIVAAAHEHDLEVMVHAVTVPAMLAAIEAGADKLVHTPHDSFMSNEDARKVAAAGIENLSTVGFAVPVFGVFNDDNVPTFRDGSPWPSGILGTGSNAAGEKVVNARTLWDNGVVYGFGTDTGYHPRDGLAHELRALNLMFSPDDIVELMGPNTAAFIDMSDELGTLEPGKVADLVVVDGDPLELIFNLLNVEIVVKGGEIVADHRFREIDVTETGVTEIDAASIPPTTEEGCFVVREVRNFDALSNEFVFVEGRRDEMFLLTMFRNCLGLRDSFEIAIQSRMSRVCSNSSADIRYRGIDGRLESCQIVKVEKVDDKAAAEALVEQRSRD